MNSFTVAPVAGIGEIHAGDDLGVLLADRARLEDGDVLVVTSKAVSKAEGRVLAADREAAVAAETARVVARRGHTTIARTRHGLVMATAGVDASNTPRGTVVLLPEDPDRSARELRARLRRLTGRNVAVVVTDTSGRAWRTGQTDIAIGAAGLEVVDDHAGRSDPYGNPLVVTAPAVADELAGAADLATGKLSGAPAAVVRGLAGLVLPPGLDGPGAAALIRDEAGDMFGLGAREAVVAAARSVAVATGGQGGGPRSAPVAGFGAVADAADLVDALGRVAPAARPAPSGRTVTVRTPAGAVREQTLLEVVAAAHGWSAVRDAGGGLAGFAPRVP